MQDVPVTVTAAAIPSGYLRVDRVAAASKVLGPGERAVVWVRGCPLRCRECIAPDSLSFEGGSDVPMTVVAEWLVSLRAPGVTFSGGEPFSQAGALAAVLEQVRARRPDYSAMAFSGFTLERLRAGTRAQQRLLAALDILVDGPYIPARHAPLRWRGSSNQRLLFLSDRHRSIAGEPDEPAGLEVDVDATTVTWVGVPPQRGFRVALDTHLRRAGITRRPGR